MCTDSKARAEMPNECSTFRPYKSLWCGKFQLCGWVVSVSLMQGIVLPSLRTLKLGAELAASILEHASGKRAQKFQSVYSRFVVFSQEGDR